MSELLLPEELERLTGSTLKKQQIETLREQGTPFLLDRDGRPVVTWEAVRVAMLRNQAQHTAPNFEFLSRVAKTAQA